MSGKDGTERLDATAGGIVRAAQILLDQGLVALPTETVYGLAARADSAAAVAEIYRAKGRPDFNPLIVHVPDLAAAEQLAHFDEPARRLAATFWPGPLTLVLERRVDSGIAGAATAGLPTIALRCPAHPVMRAVLAEAEVPLAAPSANRSGAVSPTCAEHVLAGLDGRIAAVLDSGPTARGLESTIIAIRADGWSLLRPGPVTKAELSEVAERSQIEAPSGVEAPGQLASHYAPGKPVRLDACEAKEGEFHIGFGDVAGDCTLSTAGDLVEAAARLYRCLHLAAASQKPRVAVAPVPMAGIGQAINDRLRRASS